MNLTLEEILKKVEEISKKHKVKKLYLFGSYATGTQTDTSDIDIVICGGENLEQYYHEIEDIDTLKKIDVFVYDDCKNPYLKDDINQYARIIY